METCVFPKDRALVNVQKLAFCVHLNAEEICYLVPSVDVLICVNKKHQGTVIVCVC